ncbi:hypothetical protein [Clostridioides difficile]|nr:hypothetical protein [Clostridioides difficile]
MTASMTIYGDNHGQSEGNNNFLFGGRHHECSLEVSGQKSRGCRGA